MKRTGNPDFEFRMNSLPPAESMICGFDLTIRAARYIDTQFRRSVIIDRASLINGAYTVINGDHCVEFTTPWIGPGYEFVVCS
jgi:hypothetical protein